MRPVITIASRIGRPACLLLSIGGVIACLDEGWHHGLVAALRLAGPVLLALSACWALWGWPRLRVEPTGVRVDNALQRVVIPWSSLRQVQVRWGLVLQTDAGTVRAAAAPLKGGFAAGLEDGALLRMGNNMSRRGRLANATMAASAEQRQDRPDIARMADRPTTVSMDAGRAYNLLTERLLEATNAPGALRPPAGASGPVVRSWRWDHIAMLLLGVMGTLWVLF